MVRQRWKVGISLGESTGGVRLCRGSRQREPALTSGWPRLYRASTITAEAPQQADGGRATSWARC